MGKPFQPSHVEEEDDAKDDRPSWRDFPTLVEMTATVDKEELDFPALAALRVKYHKQHKEAEAKLKTEIDPHLQAALMVAQQKKVKIPLLTGKDLKVTLAGGVNVSISGKTVAQVLLEEYKWPASDIEAFLAKVTTRSSYDYMVVTPPKADYVKGKGQKK